eukprot:6008212-Pyramimonas_sp.AAC.1
MGNRAVRASRPWGRVHDAIGVALMPPRFARPHAHRYAQYVLQRLFRDPFCSNIPTLETKTCVLGPSARGSPT